MFPILALDDGSNQRFANPKHMGHVGNVAPRCGKLSNLYYVALFKFRARVGLANLVAASTLLVSIGHVIDMCTKPKMTRVDARWAITRVANAKPFGDWLIVKLVRKTVSTYVFSPNLQPSIAELAEGSFVDPTPVWSAFVNISPKALLWSMSIFSFLAAVPRQVSKKITLAVSIPKRCADRSSCRLPAAAHAKTSRIGSDVGGSENTIVAANKALRLAFYYTFSATGLLGNGGRLSAAAFAEFYRGFVRGTIGHVKRSFQRLAWPGAFVALPGFSRS